jgi:hypothetical protein
MPQPSMAPKSMCMQVDGPMIIPWPMYAGDGLRVHSQSCARERPRMGTSRT